MRGQLIRLIGERLGVGIANAINVFDPELVVIGGGVARAGELLLEPARRTARRFVLPGVGRGRRSDSLATGRTRASSARRCWPDTSLRLRLQASGS